MAMIEPSEELLDRHFRQQVASYKEVDQSRAFLSDRLIMAKWMKVFERTPLSQKLARNSLMLLMHGHLKDFGFLKEPFTDVRNCSRNLNDILDDYRGAAFKNASSPPIVPANKSPKNVSETQQMEQQRQQAGKYYVLAKNPSLKRTSSYNLRSKKLEPIEEVSESLEKEPTSSSLASLITVIGNLKSRSNCAQESSDSQKTCSECAFEAERQSVKQRIQALEEELSKSERHPLSTSSMENVRKQCQKNLSNSGDSSSNQDSVFCPVNTEKNDSRSSSQEQLKKITNVIDEVTRRSSAVKNLKNCFEEMAERLRKTATDENALPVAHKPKIPPPVPPRNYRRTQEPIPRLTGGQALPPIFFEDKTVRDLLIRREELRVQCLEYYNSDGSLKATKDMPIPPSDAKQTELRVKGFLIGAYKALERLKRWRGKPNQLKFFGTCFRGFGLEDFGKLKALDRKFEQVALKWYRNRMLLCRRNTWRRYRRNMLVRKPSPTMEDLLKVRQQLKLQEELQRERMVHLAKIIELCRTHCSGVIRPDVLHKMLSRLDDEYAHLAGDLKSLVRQKEQLFE